MFNLPSTSSELPSADSALNNVETKPNEQILEEITEKFWIIFTIYIFLSFAWILYCLVSYRREIDECEYMKRENSVSRYIELQ
ncbi:hypothetical protein WR25_00391 [Diploscapter pachys]|uniref:Uncharacterized protein n=1 Tax=Diploscapter pachys TaxID=2018661 RepID=A0A2A2JYU9_9BILA|nr:hypothetical protein WR25_00391 [Diploscapter pachys]